MKSIFKLLPALLLVLHSAAALAARPSQQGFLKLSENRKIFYRSYAGQPGKPTLLLVNGLIYSLKNWDEFIDLSQKQGYSVIQFAFSAQPESLKGLDYSQGAEPDFFRDGLTVDDLADEVHAVYKKLKVSGKVELLTLSYGAVATHFAAKYPQLVNQLLMVAPLVVPTEKYDPNGQLVDFWLDGWRNAARWWDPLGLWSPYWYEYSWQVIWGSFLMDRMERRGTEDPNYFPAGIPKEVFKKSVFHLVRAARDFDLKDYAPGKLPVVHMMTASEEEGPALQDQLRVWELLRPATRGSLAFFAPAYHALPGAHPEVTVYWLDSLYGNRAGVPRIQKGGSYFLDLKKGKVLEVEYKELKKAIEKSVRP